MQVFMSNFSIIKQNILKYLDYKGFTKYQFYQQTGISNGLLSQKGGVSEDNTLKILNQYRDINPSWLLSGEGVMLLQDSEPNIVSEPQASYGIEKSTIPVYDIYATAGENYGSVIDHPSEYVDPGDLFRDADALIRVYGDSMGDGYQSGSFVPIRKLQNKLLIVPGFDYVIETTDYRVLKNLRKSKLTNHILACSLNMEVYERGELKDQLVHEPFDICFDDIISIFMAVGNIRRNQITNINGKK